MRLVEQAIFASSRSDGAAGYQVVAASPGLCEADARELAAWGPSHDSLLDPGPEAESLNFHPLPSGAYCVSRTVAVGWECHGGRQQVETHCLIVPREVLARFGNNPFALVHAVSWHALRDEGRDGTAEPRPSLRSGTCHPPRRLAPVAIPGGAAAVDQALLAFLAADPGPEDVAALVQAARGSVCLAVAAGHRSAPLMAGLLNCLPPECRLEFSFSTGLKFSPRRPFRVVALSGDPAQRCWVAQYPNVAVLDVRGGASPQAMPLDGWAQLIQRSLGTGQIPLLAAELSKRRFHLTLDDLPALGLQLLEALDASELRVLLRSRRPPAVRRQVHAARSGVRPVQPCSRSRGVRSPTCPTTRRTARPASISTRRKSSNGWSTSTIWSMTPSPGSRGRWSSFGRRGPSWPMSWARRRWPSRGSSISATPCRSGSSVPRPTASAIPPRRSRRWTSSACCSARRRDLSARCPRRSASGIMEPSDALACAAGRRVMMNDCEGGSRCLRRVCLRRPGVCGNRSLTLWGTVCLAVEYPGPAPGKATADDQQGGKLRLENAALAVEWQVNDGRLLPWE